MSEIFHASFNVLDGLNILLYVLKCFVYKLSLQMIMHIKNNYNTKRQSMTNHRSVLRCYIYIVY